tara:strand:- start:14286 stop:15767 length:1482 start_codon:yes stop_codon:yes gene_type:complete
MKKYIYFVTNQPHWFNIAEKLYKNNIAEPVLWLGDDIHYNKAKNIFGNNVVMDLEHRHRNYNIMNINYNGEYIDFFFSKNYLRAKDICLKMMDRLDLYGMFGRLDRETYFHKLLIWNLKKIYDSKPDVLITAEAPHDYPKYLILEICKYLNIPAYKFNNWMPVPLLFLQDLTTDKIIKKDILLPSKLDKKLNNELENFIEEIKNRSDKYELSYMKSQRINSKLRNRILNFFRKGLVENLKDIKHNLGMHIKSIYNPINPYNYNFLIRILNQRLRKKNLLKSIKLSEETIDDVSKFLYFPLHYEPERTSNPDGGFFHDQFLVLTSLRKFLPDEIDIVVKEHPSQLYFNMRGSRGRSPLFYNLIKNIKGIKLVKSSFDSIELINKSEFIATISGSVAVEASILGKKAITFGSTWYKGCPNVYQWDELSSYNHLNELRIKPVNEIYDFLISHKNNCSVPGFINGSQRNFFKKYADDEFESIQNHQIYNLLVSVFRK